jgi:hypothetical protein
MIFHPPYHENPPCGLNAVNILGHVTAKIKLKNHVVAVASDITIGRMYSGYASAD